MGAFLYREKRFFALAIAMIVAVGTAAFITIGRQEDPTITNLFATVITPYPGADPARVEALVTEKIEEELREIEEIEEIRSTSRTGISVISVELSQFIADSEIEQAWSEVRDALADAVVNLPPGVPEPDFDNDRTSAYTAISAIVARDGRDVPATVLGRYGELLQDRLRGVGGTKTVRQFGAPEEEVLVEVDPLRLVSIGLTVDAVAAAIARADAKVEAGRVRGSADDYLIEVTGEIDSLDRIRAVVLSRGVDGPLVRVADVGTVRRAVRTPVETKAFADGSRAVVVAARMEPDLQVDAWMGRLRETLRVFEEELPAGLEHRLLFDQSTYTADRLGTLAQNLAIGVGLVVAVLFVTLGWRAALVVALMLPLTSLLSLAVLQRLGVPIHQMSVTGLIVALGLLVDAAIVMTDEVGKRIREGMSRIEAVGGSVRRLFAPLMASTVTTVLSFMPMILLPGPAGDFVGSIALAVVTMLLWSFALAVTVTPAISGWVLPEKEGRTFLATGMRGGPIGRLFAWSLRWAVANPFKSVMLALVLPVLGFASFPTLTAQFFPGVDRDQFYIEVEMAGGTAMAETTRVAEGIDAVLRAEEDIAQVSWVMGKSAPAFYYNIVGGRDEAPGFAQALITSASPEATEQLVPALQTTLSRDFPSARILVRGLVQGPPVNAPVELRFVGADMGVLRELGDEARRIVADLDMVTVVRTSVSGGAPKVSLEVDEDKARLLGLDLAGVARQLEASLEGVTGGSLLEGTEQLPVRVRVGEDVRGDLAAISDMMILAPNAAQLSASGAFPGIPLSAIADVRLEPSESVISRRNSERANTVQAFLVPGVLPEEALAAVRKTLDAEGFTLPAGYRLEIGGDADARGNTMGNLLASLGIIVTLSIATIVLTFNSFRLSAVAFIVAILSAGLSILSLAVFQYPFGIQAVIGVIGSIGVSINAAIIILTGLQADAGARAGDRESMVRVVLGSSRHIISTTVTTFGGFLPLILEGGGFWPPFAMSIAGGVLLSTVVSFYFTPQMFALVYARKPRAVEALAPIRLTEPVLRPVAAE